MTRLRPLLNGVVLLAALAGVARAMTPEPPTFYVRALGDVSPAHTRWACQVVREVFRVRCRVLRAQALPQDALDRARHQYDADRLVDALFRTLPDDGVGLIGLTNADLYGGGRNHFVFGLGHLVDHVGVVSLARYRNAWWGEPDDERLFRERFFKVLVHEAGHTLGLPHCAHRGCAMRDDRSLADLDAGPTTFCARCAESIRRRVAERPGSAAWHYTRGHSHLNRGQFAQAVLHFERAVERAPRDARYRNNLGVAWLRRGDAARALWCFREAARLDAAFPNARYNEGLVFLGVGDVAMARAAFEEALAVEPTWALAHRQLGYLYLEVLGDADRAYEHFDEYLAAHGDDASVREQMRLIKGGNAPVPP
jgi:archaemetzincin